MKHYFSAFIFGVLALGVGFALGGVPGLWAVLVLSVLETSLSFDNAVVNASILKNWDAIWRRYFLVYGMPVAVFGMRLVFPLVIVGITTGHGPVSVINLAVNHPNEYAKSLTAVHHQIAAFGGSFLFMLFLQYFLDKNKDEHWLFGERYLAKLGSFDGIQTIICLLALYFVHLFLAKELGHQFLISGIFGVITYMIAESLGSLVGDEEELGSKIIKQGVGGFLYLELIDASFSFDGVIGAFALSHNIFIIALGLGVGAMFVRSMTLHLVQADTIGKYKYLEHGAFWAIGALASIMFVSSIHHVPEVISGLVGAFFIVVALVSSLMYNKSQNLAPGTDLPQAKEIL